MSIKQWIRGLALETTAADIFKVRQELKEVWQRLEGLTDLERTLKHEHERLKITLDVIDQRIEKGNAIWRQIRARERREQEREDELEEEAAGTDPRQLPLLDDAGSGDPRVRNVRTDMESDPRARIAAIRREYARRIALGG